MRAFLSRSWPDLLATGFFAVLFLPYPLAQLLPGNCDIYLGMALTDGYVAAARELFTGEAAGTVMWPDDPYRMGEALPLLGSMLAPFRALGVSWPWMVWGLLVLVFAANVWALRRCVAALTGDRIAGVVAGFGFSFANTLWAHIDDPIVIFWAIPATVTWMLVRAGDDRRLYLWAGVVGALQIYVSVYVYVFQSVWLAAWGISRLRADRAGRRALAIGAALYVGLAVPLLVFHAGMHRQVQPVLTDIPWQVVHRAAAPEIADWFAALPDNLVHGGGPITDTRESPHWVNVRRRVSFGWLWLLFGLAGVVIRGPPRVAIGITIGFGLLFELGGPWPPSTLLVELVPWLRYLRVISRAHLLVLFGATIGAGYVIARLRERMSTRRAAVGLAAVLLVHGLENLSVPLPAYETLPLHPPDGLAQALATEKAEVVLHVPADEALYMHGGRGPLFPYNRELIYMLWQTQLRGSTANGANGYITPNRLVVDSVVRGLPADVAAARNFGITHIAFHPSLARDSAELRYQELDEHSGAVLVLGLPDVRLWRLE